MSFKVKREFHTKPPMSVNDRFEIFIAESVHCLDLLRREMHIKLKYMQMEMHVFLLILFDDSNFYLNLEPKERMEKI